MGAETLEELFEHELEDIYFAEDELVDALEELADQVDDEEISQALTDHREETQTHIDRVEEVFDMIGEPPEQEECEGIEGLLKEQRQFADEGPGQEVLNLFNVTAAEKTEHYEIAAYGNLVFLADQLGMDEAADVLEQNLREEEDALDRLTELTEGYDYDSVPRDS